MEMPEVNEGCYNGVGGPVIGEADSLVETIKNSTCQIVHSETDLDTKLDIKLALNARLG